MFENRAKVFIEELINREYILGSGFNVDDAGAYIKDNGHSIVNITVEPLLTAHLYKIYCTIILLNLDALTIKFRIYDSGVFIHEMVDEVEDKIKAYEAMVKFIDS